MENWLLDDECTGCGSCNNICPTKAIQMKNDQYGFTQPRIDLNKCIDCKLCIKACPVVNPFNTDQSYKSRTYACWSLDKENRYNSTSGGLFVELGAKIISEGGFVAGAKYNEENLVEHGISDSLDGLYELRQSKYLQSNINYSFKEIKKMLLEDNFVLFSGAPCQVAGLKSYLGKNYTNLLTIEFICRGMNSPKAYQKWIEEIEETYNSRVRKVWFKYKENGWKNSPFCTKLDFDNDTSEVFYGKDNLYMMGYLGPNLYIRPSCGDCKFNGHQRHADITLADFWGIEKKLDDDLGTSLVLVNSAKGQKYFDKVSQNLFYQERDIQEIYDGNVCFSNSVSINAKSKDFLKDLDHLKFSDNYKKYTKRTIVEKIKVYILGKESLRKIILKIKKSRNS